jgi:Spy/CpxP family protein refolding chaperone
MKILRPILILTLMALAPPVWATAADTAPVESPAHHSHGAMHRLLRHLDLSADQQARVKAIHESLKPRAEALHSAARRDRDALATTPPTDPAYAALLEQSKADAAQAIQMRGDAWTQVYGVLTPEQRAKVPALLAAAHQKREERRQAWGSRDAMGPT